MILGSHFQAKFAKEDVVHGSIDWNSRTSTFEEGETDVGSQGRRVSAVRFYLGVCFRVQFGFQFISFFFVYF